jgi:GT2 family glycosyltransferase
MKKNTFISIIISVYNNEDTLPACLDSLLSIGYPNYEIILVNDASTDNTLKIMKEYEQKHKRIKVITYKINKGVPGARNEGMKAARGDVFVFSDGDCTFYKYWPSRLINALEDPKIGATGGRDISPPNEPFLKKCIDHTLTSFIGTGGLRGAKLRLAKYSVTGCNFAIKKEVVDKVGMHDERIRWRGEEKEWSQRIRDGGFNIKFVPDSFVLHYRRISLKSFWTQTYKSGKARYDILKAAPKSFELIHIVPSLYILFLLITGLFSLISVYSLYLLLFGLSSYFFILLMQSLISIFKVNNILAFFFVPLTTIIMHFAYGLGFIIKFFFNR